MLSYNKGQENEGVEKKEIKLKGEWKVENGKRYYDCMGKKMRIDERQIAEHTAKVRPVVQELARLLKEFVNDPQRDFALFWKNGECNASYGHKSFLFEDINGNASERSSS